MNSTSPSGPHGFKQQAAFPSVGVARALLEQQVPTVR